MTLEIPTRTQERKSSSATVQQESSTSYTITPRAIIEAAQQIDLETAVDPTLATQKIIDQIMELPEASDQQLHAITLNAQARYKAEMTRIVELSCRQVRGLTPPHLQDKRRSTNISYKHVS